MKMVFVKNLKGNEILSKDIYSGDGKILLKSGTRLNLQLIWKIKHYGIFFVYIEDGSLSDVTDDKKLSNLKQKTLTSLPELFKYVSDGNEKSIKSSIFLTKNLVNYIIDKKSININLFEIKNYDKYTYIHSIDTCIMSVFLGTLLSYKKDKLQDLGICAMFHDIGKTMIPVEILNKPGKLTESEYEIMKKHTLLGKDILEKSNVFSKDVIKGVEQHHERIDGSGYPYGLKGNEICEFAKIVAICDVFTAVSANRSYRKRFNPTEAYEYILGGSGTLFDEKIVANFRNNFYIYPLGCCVKLSNNIEGYVVKQNRQFPDRPTIRITYNVNTRKKIIPYEINLINHTNITIVSIVEN